MTKEKITILLTTVLALASIATTTYFFSDSQNKGQQIKSLEGKDQQMQAARLKSEETLAANEKTIAEFKADIEKMTAEKIEAERKIKSFSLQATACEALKNSAKKH